MTTIKLSDIQLILLTTAAQRADGSLLPPPDTLVDRMPRIRTAIGGLIKRLLIEEAAVTDAAQVWREEGDACIGLVITAAGREALGVEEDTSNEATNAPSVETPSMPNAQPVKPATKIATVVAMLGRDGGATLAELIEATGWLPHTTRAALTGLRKKGHALTKVPRGEHTAYATTGAA
jgi:hypothetical protein